MASVILFLIEWAPEICMFHVYMQRPPKWSVVGAMSVSPIVLLGDFSTFTGLEVG